MDLGFGLLVENCVYSRLETSGTPPQQIGQTMTKFSFAIIILIASEGYVVTIYAQKLTAVKMVQTIENFKP